MIAVQLTTYNNIGMRKSLLVDVKEFSSSHQVVAKESYGSLRQTFFAVIQFSHLTNLVYYKVYQIKGLSSFVNCKGTFEGLSIG